MLLIDNRTTREVFEGPNSRYRVGARNMPIHVRPLSMRRALGVKNCQRDSDGAFRWARRIDGNNPGGLGEPAKAAE